MRVYIAGPITGIMDYKEKFIKAEKQLKEMGHIVINPAYLPEGLSDYMGICKAMIDQADAVLFLAGWERSKGSCIERDYSFKKGKRVFEALYL